MRIIVWGINYSPELTGIGPFNAGLCDYLAERGHQVEMVTTFSYYPRWKKAAADRGQLFRTDRIGGVPVHRCWHYVPARATTLRRIWHELSFVLASWVRVLFLARPEVYLVVSPPLLLGPFASIMARIKRRPYVFHVQDLQPDAAVGLGMVDPGAFTRLLYRLESWAYRDAALVSGISDAMIRAFARKGVPAAKRTLFPNWLRRAGRNADYLPPARDRDPASRAFREKYEIPGEAFLASYSGNLGRKQGLETLVAAAARLSKSAPGPAEGRIVILLVGDGVMRQALEQQITSLDLARSVRLMPLLADHEYQAMLAASDLCLVTQAPGTGQYFLPSKLLSVLSAGAAVLSVADRDSELAVAVGEGQFGVNVVPGDPVALAAALADLAQNPASLERLRLHTAWVGRFSASKVLGEFERRLLEIE
jgi:colanic acid biosynthesis glycosyl transferase WcaI